MHAFLHATGSPDRPRHLIKIRGIQMSPHGSPLFPEGKTAEAMGVFGPLGMSLVVLRLEDGPRWDGLEVDSRPHVVAMACWGVAMR